MAESPIYICTVSTLEQTERLASSLARYLRVGDVVVLNGDLGAGKTRFVQGVASALGIESDVTSPTFNILLSYDEGRLPLNHFDLYRLEYDDQLEDIGYWETLEGDGASFVEWGDKFPESQPDDCLQMNISVGADGVRTVAAQAGGERSRELLTQWAADEESKLRKADDE